MIRLKGIAVSVGIAIGKARILARDKIVIEKKKIKPEKIESELERFNGSVNCVIDEINQLLGDISANNETSEILKTHKLILEDPDFIASIQKMISEELHSLEHAVHQHFTNVIDLFKNMKNDYFAERSSDYEDIAYRLLNHIMQSEENILDILDEDSIVFANNITPSGVTKVYARNIKGICTEKGNKNSHSSIIARSMNLPYVARIQDLLQQVENDDQVILDGNKGKVIINPDDAVLKEYQEMVNVQIRELEELQKLIGLPVITSDEKKVGLMGNIEIPAESEFVKKLAIEGIGLFRTEFLFIDRDELPAEQEQYEIYKKIAETMAPDPLIIRTIDVGGDKLSRVLNLETELNPNLGCRGIRISLQHKPIFKTQIRAILRASVGNNIKVMFPMISSCEEIQQVKELIDSCKKELKKKGQPFDERIKIGAMIEIPSAALTSEKLAQECDFFSIGTNDLIQYTLAVDRDNQTVDKYYIPHHPSVLDLIKLTVENAHKHDVKVAVCGEMASQTRFIPLLLGMGVDELSVSPGAYLKIKQQIRKMDLSKMKKWADKILKISTVNGVYNELKDK